MTKKIVASVFALVSITFIISAYSSHYQPDPVTVPVSVDSAVSSEVPVVSSYAVLYEQLGLASLKLNRQAFDLAIKGYDKLKAAGKIRSELLTIVDFTQPSTNKRMYIIDMLSGKLVKHSHVAHGRNTGMLMAKSFSNVAESNQSSLGFYVTSETYTGKHGLSLRLDGMEKNINDNARARAIVIHGADYANESFYKTTGYLGRSFGCPAVPTRDANQIIQTIKNGSCLFLFSNDAQYLKKSGFLS